MRFFGDANSYEQIFQKNFFKLKSEGFVPKTDTGGLV